MKENINIYNEIKEKNIILIRLIEDFFSVDHKNNIKKKLTGNTSKIRAFNKDLKIDIFYRKADNSITISLQDEQLTINALKAKNEKIEFAFIYKDLIITREDIKYSKPIKINYKIDSFIYLKLKVYNNSNAFIFKEESSKFDFLSRENKDKQAIISRLNKYNINIKKILLGDYLYVDELKNEIELEKLMEDSSYLENLISKNCLFGIINFNDFVLEKKELSLYKKIINKIKF